MGWQKDWKRKKHEMHIYCKIDCVARLLRGCSFPMRVVFNQRQSARWWLQVLSRRRSFQFVIDTWRWQKTNFSIDDDDSSRHRCAVTRSLLVSVGNWNIYSMGSFSLYLSCNAESRWNDNWWWCWRCGLWLAFCNKLTTLTSVDQSDDDDVRAFSNHLWFHAPVFHFN